MVNGLDWGAKGADSNTYASPSTYATAAATVSLF